MTDTGRIEECPTMAFDVFISYSTRNKKIADAMKQYLQSKGIRCWKAPDDIVHGESWAAAIPRAIKNSQIMVLIWTVDSMNSRQVVNELTLADRAQKMIIPFRTEPIEPENEFGYYLAKTHWFDAFGSNNDKGFELLSQRVLRNLDESARPSAKEGVSTVINHSLASAQGIDTVDSNGTETSTTEDIVDQEHLETSSRPLQGDELIAKIKEHRDASKSDLVRICGYASMTKNGKERLHSTTFYEALLEAKGLNITEEGKAMDSEVMDLLESAVADMEKENYISAIQRLDQAIERAAGLNYFDSELHYNRAIALSSVSKYKDALADLTLATEMSKEPERDYYRLRGIVHEELGDLALACADWRVAAELGDTDSQEWIDAQCTCDQNSLDENRAIDAAYTLEQENGDALSPWNGPSGGKLQPLDIVAIRESPENNSPEDIERQITAILEEAEALTSDSIFKTRSYYRLNPGKRYKLLCNHSLSNNAVSVYLFFSTSLLRAKNGILLTDHGISLKDFWKKPLFFSYYEADKGILAAQIEVLDENISVSIYRESEKDGPSLVHRADLDLHNLAHESSFYDRDFLQRRVPELIRLLGLSKMAKLHSSWQRLACLFFSRNLTGLWGSSATLLLFAISS